jgi:drug/metabolite transporter (DMT)-like permease
MLNKLSARNKAYLALLLNVTIWGAALPVVKPALNFISPYEYLFYRYLIAAPVSLIPLIFLLKKLKPNLKSLLTIVGMEIIQLTVYLSILYEGLSRTTSLEATFIANTSAIFVILGGFFFLKEKIERHELVGLSLAICGTILLTLEPIISGRNDFGVSSLTGNFLILTANLFWALYILLAKKFYKNIPKILVGFLSPFIGFFSFFILVFVTSANFSFITLLSNLRSDISLFEVILACSYMALPGTIIAVPLYIYGNDLIEASEATLFTYLQPLIAIPLATIWLKEPINILIIFSLLLSTFGVYLAEKRMAGRKKLPTNDS